MTSPFALPGFQNPDDDALRALLQRTKRLAVVGLSPKPYRDSHRVARYMAEHGYALYPVYPREEEILGRKVYRTVAEIPRGVDLVNVFRRSEELAPVFDDALAAGAPALWTQYDCVDVASAARARQKGVLVVMDRCLMVEHARLIGR